MRSLPDLKTGKVLRPKKPSQDSGVDTAILDMPVTLAAKGVISSTVL